MTDLLKKAYDPEQFRRQGHQLVDRLADYLNAMQLDGSTEKVLHYLPPDELYERWKADMAQAPNPDLPGYFEAILRDTIHMHHPRYMGHQTSNVAPVAALAELAGGLPDPGMGVYEQGTAGVVLERLIADALGREIGWGDATGGFLTSGGTLGNLTALLCARQAMISEAVGLRGYNGKQ